MDEVDLDGEDYNELEARLYGQIHHEAVDECTTTSGVANTNKNTAEAQKPYSNDQQAGEEDVGKVERIVTARSVVNRPANASRVPGTRYWAKDANRPNSNNNNNSGNQNNKSTNNNNKENHVEVAENIAELQNKEAASQQTSNNNVKPQPNQQPQQLQHNEEEEDEIEPDSITSGSCLLINPAALAKNVKTKQNKKKKSKGIHKPHVPRAGPFAQQEAKLEKALVIKAKKQKSKKVREKARKGILRANETIVLESSTETEEDSEDAGSGGGVENASDDDVVLIPVKPPPLITLSDSDNEQMEQQQSCDVKTSIPQIDVEENAMDASDVALDGKIKSNNFSKPTVMRGAAGSDANAADRRVEPQTSSRCTSPCSVLSSDDFIGQSDRRRLLQDSCMADDEDLALLTADVDSLMQQPSPVGGGGGKEHANMSATAAATCNNNPTDDVICTAEFAAPVTALNATTVTSKPKRGKKPAKQTADYRVEQTDFRALDVYESESDINESVYSKGVTGRNNTIINAIGSSSEEDDVQQAPTKVKRLSKRRTSSSRIEDEASTDDDERADHHVDGCDAESDGDGVAKTGIPYIMRGTAVERRGSNKKFLRKRAQSLNIRRRRASAGVAGSATKAATPGTISDTEFIATLNSLVQGHDTTVAATAKQALNEEIEEEENEIVENAGENVSGNECENSEGLLLDLDNVEANADENVFNAEFATENESCAAAQAEQQQQTPFASNRRPIKCDPDQVSLASVQIIEPPPPSNLLTEAVPDEAMAGLDKIFESIDNLAEKIIEKQSTNYDNSSSDDDIEVIQPPVVTTTAADAEQQQQQQNERNTLPLRHVVYSERGSQLEGIGWTDEMTKFYNFSWQGEFFTLMDVQREMERDGNLWRIHAEDRFPKRRPHSNLKCYNCCEFGHTRAKCVRPKKPLICYMCGESGHLEPRCPNTICLRCGNKTQVFTRSCNACTFQNRLICPICKVRGHTINLCPDKWRRYHSTTQPNAHPNSHVELNRRKVCCACGAIGHLSDTCRSPARFMEYPVIVAQVKSHQKSYNDMLFKTARTGIAYNLLYRPADTIAFHMAEKTKPNNYYGRFLRAVGMEHLLQNRKRAYNSMMAIDEANQATPAKKAKAAKGQRLLSNPCFGGGDGGGGASETAPDQVQEVSGSVNEEEIDDNEAAENDLTEEMHTQQFKTPHEVTAATTTTQQTHNLAMDSDSNYSFSDHFEMPNTDAAVDENERDDVGEQNEDADESVEQVGTLVEEDEEQAEEDEQPSTSAAAAATVGAKRVREMDPLPDYIPLGDSSTDAADAADDEPDNFDVQTGISRCFVAAETDDEENEKADDDNVKKEIPCEAKIYLTRFHSNYLLSPDGHNFLVNKTKECNIQARLDWTTVGHVLVIFGLPKQQDIFHKALLAKCHELMDQMANKQQMQAVKVPKRIDALIRFLRDNISQLQNDLGDVNDLQRRIKNLEQTHTKANTKLAEKCRRLLNMILLGQAGLRDGDKHLSKLLLNLKSLINDYQAENMVPQSLREEIDSHAKMIFTSYRHTNYPELIQTYNRMTKSQKCNINIDPLLLGQKMLDTSFTAEQRARLEQPQGGGGGGGGGGVGMGSVGAPISASNANNSATLKILNSPAKHMNSPQSNLNSPQPTFNSPYPVKSKMPQNIKQQSPKTTQQAQTNNNNYSYKAKFNTNLPPKRQNSIIAPPPFVNPQQRSNVQTTFQQNMQNQQQQQYGHKNVSAGNNAGGFGGGGNKNGRLLQNGQWKQLQQQRPPPPQQKQQQFHVGDIDKQRDGDASVATAAGGGGSGPSQGPSVFWSRESMRYLDECIQLAEANTELMEKLQRIQSKADEGALSYNDYRAVIKLHGHMVGN